MVEIDDESCYDEDFENDLLKFQERLEQGQEKSSSKLKPNISEDWLNKIRVISMAESKA